MKNKPTKLLHLKYLSLTFYGLLYVSIQQTMTLKCELHDSTGVWKLEHIRVTHTHTHARTVTSGQCSVFPCHLVSFLALHIQDTLWTQTTKLWLQGGWGVCMRSEEKTERERQKTEKEFIGVCVCMMTLGRARWMGGLTSLQECRHAYLHKAPLGM